MFARPSGWHRRLPVTGTESSQNLNGETELPRGALAREWLARRDLRDAPELVIDSSWYEDLAPSPIEVEKVVVNDLFSAGDRVAFHVSQTGPYRGGLPGVARSRLGHPARLDCVGLARVAGGRVSAVRAVTDRMGTARVLLGAG